MEWFLELEIQYKVTLISVLATVIMSTFSLYFSVRNNKAVHYVNAVTKSRIEWIQKLRDLCSEYVSVVNISDNVIYAEETDEDIENAGKYLIHCRAVAANIKLMLNFSDDRELIKIVDEIMEYFSEYYHAVSDCEKTENKSYILTEKMREQSKMIDDKLNAFVELVQIYLKAEWNRIKYESQGKAYEKSVQAFDMKELKEKYKDPNYRNKIWKRKGIVILAKTVKLFPICIVRDLKYFLSLKLDEKSKKDEEK